MYACAIYCDTSLENLCLCTLQICACNTSLVHFVCTCRNTDSFLMKNCYSSSLLFIRYNIYLHSIAIECLMPHAHTHISQSDQFCK